MLDDKKPTWETVVNTASWLVMVSPDKTEISQTHHSSLTRSEVSVKGAVIQRLTVFSTTRDSELTTDQDAGHWTKVHGEQAQKIILGYFK